MQNRPESVPLWTRSTSRESRIRTLGGTFTRTMPAAAKPKDVPSTITIALIEDNRLVRESLVSLINQQAGLKVVVARAAGDPHLLQKVGPHVVLLDIGLRKGDSLRIAADMREQFPNAKVIVMDLLPAHEDIVEYVNAGVTGFILKDATLEDLVATIRSVAAGLSVLPTAMVNTLFSQIARDAVERGAPALMESVKMTPRERQVTNLIAEGLSNKEIAARLHIAVHTVKSHVRNVMEKLTLHSRLQIAAYAHQQTSP